MVLNLIRYYSGDIAIKLLDDKLYLIYDDIDERLGKIEKQLTIPTQQEKKQVNWQGFGKK